MTSRSGLSSLWSSDISDWTQRALCAGLDPGIFEPADADTHPKLNNSQRATVTEARWQEAKKICGNCPVRRECEDKALTPDKAQTVRGGITPAERSIKLTTYVTKGGRPGRRPKEDPRAGSPELEHFTRLFREGHTDDELRALTGFSEDRTQRLRMDFLNRYTQKTKPDAVIKSWLKSEKTGKIYAQKIGGPAWTLGQSSCGTLVHVAIRREGRVRSLILRSSKIEFARSDVPTLKGSRRPQGEA